MSEWANVAFGELFKTVYRYPTYFGIQYVDKGVIEIRGELLTANGMIAEDFRFISSGTASKFPKVRLEEGDFVMSVRGTVGKIGRIKKEHEGAVITANLLRLSPDRAKAETGWLLQVLLSPKFLEQLENACSQTTIRTIQVPPLSKLRIDCPPLYEQNRIAEILSTLDETIEQTEALIAKYQQIKAGLMHDLFTRGVTPDGKLRPTRAEAPQLYKESSLGWIPKEWEVGELRQWLSYLSYGFTNPMPEADEGPYMVTAADIYAGRIQYYSCRRTTRKAFEELLTQKSRPRLGDVLVTKDGTLGRVAIVDRTDVCINQSVAVLRPADTRHAPFIASMLSAPMWQQKMLSDAGGSTIKHIYITVIDKMLVPWPSCAQEVNTICAAIESCTAMIERQDDELAKLREQKHGLMHDLLTGRMRVKVGD